MKTSLAVVVALLAAMTQAEAKWDGLRVTWSRDPTNQAAFVPHPRTIREALDQGFVPVDGGSGTCSDSGYYGSAYAKNGDDYAVTLLFDVNGYIAGIQAGITYELSQANNYPTDELMPMFVAHCGTKNRYIISAYFTEPSKICTHGRTKADFDRDGTGEGLWIQTGQYPNNVTRIPRFEKDIQAPWGNSKCFHTMGNHYWYNLHKDANCDEFYPVFLLYDGGELTGWGWAFRGDLQSNHYERPTFGVTTYFMQEPPQCLKTAGTLSTMHIYMVDNPQAIRC